MLKHLGFLSTIINYCISSENNESKGVVVVMVKLVCAHQWKIKKKIMFKYYLSNLDSNGVCPKIEWKCFHVVKKSECLNLLLIQVFNKWSPQKIVIPESFWSLF